MRRLRRTSRESIGAPQVTVASFFNGGELPKSTGRRGRHRAERSGNIPRRAGIVGAFAVALSILGSHTLANAETTPGAMVDNYSHVQGDVPTITAGGAGQSGELTATYNGVEQERVAQPATVFNIGFNPTQLFGEGPWSGIGDHSLEQTEDVTRDAMLAKARETGSNTLAGYSAGSGGTLEAGAQLAREGGEAYVTLNDSEYTPGGFADQVNANPLARGALSAVGVNFSEQNSVNNLPAGVNVTYNTVDSVWSGGVAKVDNNVLKIRNPIDVVEDTVAHYNGTTDPGNFQPTRTETYQTENGANVTVNTMDVGMQLPDIEIPLPPPAPAPEQVITQTQNDFNTFVDQAEQVGLPPQVADQGRQVAADIANTAQQANDAINTQIEQANNFVAGLFPPPPAP